MLVSTLPDLPGQTFQVKGIVCAQGVLQAIKGDKIENLIQSLVQQATTIGANGIVDVRTAMSGASGHCVVTGTAVTIG